MKINILVACIVAVGLLIAVFLINSYINRTRNYENAYIITKGGTQFIKLKGRRRLMVHDPISMLLNKTYEDSTLLPVSAIKDSVINGADVPVEKGYYKFKGTVSIKGRSVIVNLFINDTDDKTLPDYDWNGDYNLIK